MLGKALSLVTRAQYLLKEAQWFLDGKKTVITAFVMASLNLLVALDIVYISPDDLVKINGALTGAMGWFLRLGLSKV